MALTLYDYSNAPSPRRARMILAEKEIPHRVEKINLQTGEQLSPEFLAINPGGTVPALRLEDDTVLFENWGIALWAEAEKPEPSLLGKSPAEQGLVGSWTSKIDFAGTLAFAEAYRNSVPHMKDRSLTGVRNFPQIEALAERGRQRLEDFKALLDNRLEGREFIAIDSFSLADIWALTILDSCRWLKMGVDEKHPNLLAWHDHVSDRDSAEIW